LLLVVALRLVNLDLELAFSLVASHLTAVGGLREVRELGLGVEVLRVLLLLLLLLLLLVHLLVLFGLRVA